MTKSEQEFYEKVRNNPKDRYFDRLFEVNEEGAVVPKPGTSFQLLGGIPCIQDNFFHVTNALPLSALKPRKGNPGLGETIRGMKHVSPLATFKFSSRSSAKITRVYFPDAKKYEIGCLSVIVDYETTFDKKIIPEIFYRERTDEFRIKLYVSKDEKKVQEIRECVDIEEGEALLFLHNGNIYSKISTKVLSLLEEETFKLKIKNELGNNFNIFSQIIQSNKVSDYYLKEVLIIFGQLLGRRNNYLLSVNTEVVTPCVVQFRPPYMEGEEEVLSFGFDWMRLNDTKIFKVDTYNMYKKMHNDKYSNYVIAGDQNYEDIVGYHYTDDRYTAKIPVNLSYRNYDGAYPFKPDESLYNKLKEEYSPYWVVFPESKRKIEYFIPWLSLVPPEIDKTTGNLKREKATFNIIIDFDSLTDLPEYLEFGENPYFKFSKRVQVSTLLKSAKKDAEIKNRYGMEKVFTIECIGEFSEDQELVLYAVKNGEKYKAGSLKVWANDDKHQLTQKITVVQIETPPLSDGRPKKGDFTKVKQKVMGKYLQQAYVKAEVDIIDLDLNEDVNFKPGGGFTVKNEEKVWGLVTNTELEGKYSSLQAYFNTRLQELAKKDEKIKLFLEDHAQGNRIFIYYLGESCGTLGGYSASEVDIVIFNDNWADIYTHEIFHSLGLKHSFATSAQFTYEGTSTDNIMDYENKRYFTWHWQWERIHKMKKNIK